MNIQSFPITPTAIQAMIVPLPTRYTRSYGDLYQTFASLHPNHSNPTTVIFDHDGDTNMFWLYDLIGNFAINAIGEVVQLPGECSQIAHVKALFRQKYQIAAQPA